MKHMAVASMTIAVVMLLMSVAPALSGKTMVWPLQYDFYRSLCPKAEEGIRKTTWEIISQDPTMGAAFLKLFYEDCFNTYQSSFGCDASLLLEPEKSANKMIRGSDAVNKIKTAVEAICPGVISCADIIALAARDSTAISGGFSFPMPTGRRDALVSYPKDTFRTPDSYWTANMTIPSFARRGIDVDDLVVLSGAHSFGIAHCSSVDYRLIELEETALRMNASDADELNKLCPRAAPSGDITDMGAAFNMNRVTDPNVLSNQFYSNVLIGRVLFVSDQTLMNLNETAAKVALYAANPLTWMGRFATALVRLGVLQVLTGTQGEVRKVCNATNH
ncbi:hypothetical protein EJB05_34039, partial [Eragrostis curvula]